MANHIAWFDLRVADLERATKFYSGVLDVEITEEFPGVAVFAHGPGDVTGCLFKNDKHAPSKDGVLLYFDVSGRLEAAADSVEQNGGTIEQPPHEIGSFGRRVVAIDSEGNRIALHSE